MGRALARKRGARLRGRGEACRDATGRSPDHPRPPPPSRRVGRSRRGDDLARAALLTASAGAEVDSERIMASITIVSGCRADFVEGGYDVFLTASRRPAVVQQEDYK